jgi:hypothetical protein
LEFLRASSIAWSKVARTGSERSQREADELADKMRRVMGQLAPHPHIKRPCGLPQND